jgi:hypothetical protein
MPGFRFLSTRKCAATTQQTIGGANAFRKKQAGFGNPLGAEYIS